MVSFFTAKYHEMSSLETSLHLVSQAIYQEEAQNFEEAARCYHDAIMGFKHVVTKNKNLSPKVRESILHKCVIAEDRVKKLDRYLFNKADLTSLFKSCVDFHENIPKNESLETFGNKSMDDPRFSIAFYLFLVKINSTNRRIFQIFGSSNKAGSKRNRTRETI